MVDNSCSNSFTVVPPCPPACAEVFSAECIVYTGRDLTCTNDIVIKRYDYLDTVITKLVDYFCANGGGGTGSQGPIGPQGLPGPQGVVGPAGPAGATGPQGVAGPVGPAGLNWKAVWSPIGVYAVNDAVSYGGASWFCINPVGPSGSTPDTDPTNWALLASQGSPGSQGPAGVPGPQGPQGAQGPQGPAGIGTTGPIGLTGPQGPIGPQGPQGPAGPAGAYPFTYEIGEYVASEGGVIIHRWLSTTPYGVPDVGSVQNYIVMDLADISSGAAWGLMGTNVSNCESTWDGFTNTASMITAGAAVGTAAQLCDASTNGGKIDWYLPAIDELSMIWQNRFLINLNVGVTPGFNSLVFNNYWSSTENGNFHAWFFSFLNGTASNTSNNAKNATYYVRAVRRFSI
jgi:hypothetical protein